MSQRPHRLFFVSLAFVFASLLSSCASFKGGDLPERTQADLVAPAAKSTASLEFGWTTNGTHNATAAEFFIPKILEVMESSEQFSSVREGAEPADYQFSLVVANSGNRFVAGLTGFLCGLTLFAFPGYARDNYDMSVTVKHGGAEVSELSYEGHMTTWLQWFMVFFAFTHTTSEVPDEIVENMVWNMLYDLQQDGVLPAR